MYLKFAQMSRMRGGGATFDFQVVSKWRQHVYQPGNRGLRNPAIKYPLLTLLIFFFPT